MRALVFLGVFLLIGFVLLATGIVRIDANVEVTDTAARSAELQMASSICRGTRAVRTLEGDIICVRPE